MTDQSYFGQQGTFDDLSDFNVREFHIRQLVAQVRTAIPVKVVAVHGGGVAAPPTVDVQPLINQIDGDGNQTPHGIINNIPVARNQGGGNAIIIDPQVNDVGHMVIGDRDASALKANAGARSNPGSFRMHDLADGVYHGAILNPANPDQYIQFTTTGIKQLDRNGNTIETDTTGIKIEDKNGNTIITSDAGINLNGFLIARDGTVTVAAGIHMNTVTIDPSGNLATPGSVVAGNGSGDSVTLQHHVHGSSPAPTPGT